RPDLFDIGFWHLKFGHCTACVEFESSFGVSGWQCPETLLQFKQEHEPVRLPFVTVFADDACEVQLTWFNDKPQFFGSLAACACVRRLAVFGQEFASARTPKPEVRLARAFEQ